MNNKKEFRTTINLPSEVGKLIKAIAKEQDRSTASLLRIIITNYVKSYDIEVSDEIINNNKNIYEAVNVNETDSKKKIETILNETDSKKKTETIINDEKIIRPPSKIRFSGFGLNKR